MTYSYQRSYRGPLQAVILDWAGTTVDFGSLAPVRAFMDVFARHGVPIAAAEARAPMGAEKREHITRLMHLPGVRQRWAEHFGQEPEPTDINRLYEAFIPLQLEAIRAATEPVPGLLDTVAELRRRGYRIGANTGYNRDMLTVLQTAAAAWGYRPDSSVCADDTPRGRPYPHMCLQNAIELEIETVHACVKVDDTLPGVEEGLNAGMWSIAVAVSGNEVGLALSDWNALPPLEQQQRRAVAQRRLHRAGAHYVIDTVADLLPCLDDIEARLGRGEKP